MRYNDKQTFSSLSIFYSVKSLSKIVMVTEQKFTNHSSAKSHFNDKEGDTVLI